MVALALALGLQEQSVRLVFQPTLGHIYHYSVVKSSTTAQRRQHLEEECGIKFRHDNLGRLLGLNVLVGEHSNSLPPTIFGPQGALSSASFGPANRALNAWNSILENPAYVFYPERPVKVGDKWSHTVNLHSVGADVDDASVGDRTTTGQATISYKLSGIANGKADIEVTTDSRIEVKVPSLLAARSDRMLVFPTVSRQSSFSGHGHLTVDLETGLPTEVRLQSGNGISRLHSQPLLNYSWTWKLLD